MVSTDGKWPYPGDAPLVIARSVANFYRQRLAAADPSGCAAADAQMRVWGQGWAVSDLMPDLDDWLSPAEAAVWARVSVATIAEHRRSGRLPGVKRHGAGWRYLARDVFALSRDPRTRARGGDR